VTSPQPATLVEAHFFQDKTRELELPLRAFVLNRSRALNVDKPIPDLSLLGGAPDAEGRAALEKLQGLARVELELAGRDVALLRDLQTRAGATAIALALPELPQGADDLGTLLTVADVLDRA
jgi:hypothetical protein